MMTAPLQMTAIVPAGRRPGKPDPLAQRHGAAFKAQVRVGGEAMLSRVVRTLLSCPEIGDVVVLVQEPDALLDHADLAWLAGEPRVRFERSDASISASVHRLLTSGKFSYPALLTTADHVLLTPAMIAHFTGQAQQAQADVALAMVERRVLLATYPDSLRTWLKFTDGWWSGANLFGLFSARVLPALTLWQTVEQDRKKGWKIVAAFGPWLLLRALTKTLSLKRGLALAGAKLGLTATLVPMPMAEACIDVDKQADLELAEQILRARH
jgi:GTP:adenosylcobinamide-phosphate guanylyltransferase